MSESSIHDTRETESTSSSRSFNNSLFMKSKDFNEKGIKSLIGDVYDVTISSVVLEEKSEEIKVY